VSAVYTSSLPSPIPFLTAVACVAILCLAAGFHFYWGFGGKVGLSVSLPQREDGEPIIQQSAVGAHAVGLALVIATLTVLLYMGVFGSPLPRPWLRGMTVLLAAVFGVRALSAYRYVGLFKTVHHTRFARYDTWLYSPLCLCVAVGLGILVATEI
jgi:uncharacterized protein DUF3995